MAVTAVSELNTSKLIDYAALPYPTAVQHLYVHIPFCARRCSYCDFNTYTGIDDRIPAYVAALCREIDLLPGERQPHAKAVITPRTAGLLPADRPLMAADLRPTVFFGGGTPSMLSTEQIATILTHSAALIPLENAEITLEANPGSVLGRNDDPFAYLQALRVTGVNRLSFGVQTLDDQQLRLLGRSHTADDARRCLDDARRAGFENVSLDFIFGLPGQTLDGWITDLRAVIAWQPDHLSLYSLILEEKTPLAAQVMRGQVSVPDDDLTGAMYEAAIEILAAEGYSQYEISNWARDPQRYPSHHNLSYWLNSDYLAAGAGAHGHLYPQRFANVLAVPEYLRMLESGTRPVAQVTPLELRDLYAETMFMGLRLNQGVGFAHFQQRCGADMESIYGPILTDLEQDGLLERTPDRVHLTARGRMLGNRVFEQFV